MSRLTLLAFIGLSVGCGGKVIFDTSSMTGGGGSTTTTSTQSHTTATSSTNVTTTTTHASSSTGPSTIIACGMNACDDTHQECCASPMGAFCQQTGSPCMGLAMHCSSAANCPAPQLCCSNFANVGNTATCQPKCTNGQQLCATTAECSNGETCADGPNGVRFCTQFIP
jgi:hypothetical protein